MNAHSSVRPAEGLSPLDPLAKAGHEFRGRFIDECSKVEQWASRILEAVGRQPRDNHFLGHKLQAIRALAEASPSPFRAPKRVLALLEELRPFVELRACLAHSVQTVAMIGDDAGLILFTPPCGTEPEWLRPDWVRILLDRSNMKRLPGQLAAIAKKLNDQGLKATPSSPPPPRPAGAAGP